MARILNLKLASPKIYTLQPQRFPGLYLKAIPKLGIPLTGTIGVIWAMYRVFLGFRA